MKRAVTISGLAFLLALASGCAGFGTYLKNRGNDLADCFKADIGIVGVGAELHVRVTDAFVTGAGAGLVFKSGFKGRHFEGFFTDAHVGLPISPIYWFVRDDKIRRNFPITYFCQTGNTALTHMRGMGGSYEAESFVFYPVAFEKAPVHEMHEQNVWRPRGHPFEKKIIDSFDIEVGGTIAIILGLSVHVGFSPGQFLDFLLGWFGPDIGNDDSPPPIFVERKKTDTKQEEEP